MSSIRLTEIYLSKAPLRPCISAVETKGGLIMRRFDINWNFGKNFIIISSTIIKGLTKSDIEFSIGNPGNRLGSILILLMISGDKFETIKYI